MCKVQSAAPLVALATAVVLACATLAGQDKGVKASNAWIRLPAGGDTEATAFVTIENPGMYEVNVTGAKSDAAGKVELRDGGQSVTFINVPPYGRVDMAPGGIHLLLIGLKQPLRGGDTVALVLSTDVDVTLTVSARVREP
jgi:hypothetical protein